jgi:tRNA 2-(methylsulfanyl)-N6-isopentenyladenosine37 hydroxylase
MSLIIEQLLKPINSFLQCPTPQSWIDEAIKPKNLADLLVDHCNCELKAAQTAMFLIRRYAVDKLNAEALLAWLKPYEDFVYRRDFEGSFSGKHAGLSKAVVAREDVSFGAELVDKMVLLIKEELHHFQQVLDIMSARGIEYTNVRAGRYAKGMMKHVRTHEPAALVDKLICGALIEARSCERFAKLAPYLDDELNKFYVSLLRSEARHFQDYLDLATKISGSDIRERIQYFAQIEAQLIISDDLEF